MLIATWIAITLACSSKPQAGDFEDDVGDTEPSKESKSGDTATDPHTTDPSADASSDNASSGDADDTPCDTCDESLPKFDLGDQTLDPQDTDSQGMLECKKIDLLFAIDTSGSMGDEQEKLLDAFPKFATSIREQLEQVESIHIGLVSSDENTANDPATCQVTGGLIVQGACKEALAGKRYIDEDDAIESAFACNAAIGQGGHPDNRTMANLTQALALDGECNAGFLRDDALLVLVIITDEEDDHDVPANSYPGSPGDPPDWFEAVVAAKGGEAKRAVVMAIVQPPPPNACSVEQNSEPIVVWAQGNRIIEFTETFDHHVVADICASDYAAPFQAFLHSISQGCEEFIPPK